MTFQLETVFFARVFLLTKNITGFISSCSMFLRPSSTVGDANVVISSRPRSIASQNENLHLSAKAGAKASETTTPAKSISRPRRAFGDISNKKVHQSKNGKGQSNNNAAIVLKPQRSSAASTPHNSSAPKFQSRIPKTAGSKLTKRIHPWSTQGKPSSANPKSQVVSSRQVEFILPVAAGPTQEETDSISLVVYQPKHTTAEPVDDVELPAGRSWEQQLKTDDPLGEDDLSTGSLGEVLDRRTMWDDWKETMLRQWEDERLQRQQDDEREVKAQLDRFLQDEERGRLRFQFCSLT